MFSLFRRQPAGPDDPQALAEALAAEADDPRAGHFRLAGAGVAQRIAGAVPEAQRLMLLGLLKWLRQRRHSGYDPAAWRVQDAITALLRRRLPLQPTDVLTLCDWAAERDYFYRSPVPHVLKAVENHLRQGELTPELRAVLEKLAARLETGFISSETRRWAARARELGGQETAELPLERDDPWGEAVRADVGRLEASTAAHWIRLLRHAGRIPGSAPSDKWLRAGESLLQAVAPEAFREALLRWFALAEKPQPERPYPACADLLCGLAWLCSTQEDTALARALGSLAASAYRRLEDIGPRAPRVGNACIGALGRMPGAEGASQLAVLKAKVKQPSAQKAIARALAAAAEKAGLTPEAIAELAVPSYGLQSVGLRQDRLGEYTSEISISGHGEVTQAWLRADGRRQKSVPAAARNVQPQAVRELGQVMKDLRRMLPAQRDRLEALCLEPRQWPLAAWRELYLDHPLVGTLARRLIWKFSCGDRAASAIWHAGQLVERSGRALDWLSGDTQVELWHPLSMAPEAVLEWRAWLAAHDVQQPFKQAHREVYLLTDAERVTRTYSNRFAAHVLKQHQFNALCAARGWRNQLRLMVDDTYEPATRLMPAWGLRAEFWVEGAGDTYGTDTNDVGTYLYLTTDQVRFYTLEARPNYAHAGGGGYHAGRWGADAAPAEPLPLDSLPPRVLSEILRDVDLFVGVASVGNDPTWADGGPVGRYQAYWQSYSFGELAETARTRRQVLEGLLPRLKIAARCRLTERFLVVRGDRRTYKIHLGSANILMEPNDQYLCIVPARGAGSPHASGRVYLPFEGDQTLAVILSKAFLLADDTRITDPTILRQIGR